MDLLLSNSDPGDPFLARRSDGATFLIEGAHRRRIRSGLLAAALERALGDTRVLPDATIDQLDEGAPVEVMEAAKGPPFVIVARRRMTVRGLPLPTPIPSDEALAFQEGPELQLRPDAQQRSEKAELGTEPPLPDFLIIGAQKSATRWLRANLGRHADIFTAAGEPSFFNSENRFYHSGVEWYREQFQGWSGEAHVGESTPGYMMWRHGPDRVARRIEQVLPDVQLITLLRNPVDRAVSATLHHIRRGRLPSDADMIELARRTPPAEDQLGLIAGGWYAASLGPYLRRFGDRVLVLLHDDLVTDAAGVYAKALDHIGADPAYQPGGLAEIRFSSRSSGGAYGLTHEARCELYEYFREDVEALEEMIGRELSRWDPTRDDGAVRPDGDHGEPTLADDAPEDAPEQEDDGANPNGEQADQDQTLMHDM